jgi:hypothetical protein
MFLNGFLDVNSCLKSLEAVFSVIFLWEKSMFSSCVFFVVCSPDCGHYSLGNVDGVESLE